MSGHGVGRSQPTGPLDPSLLPIKRRPSGQPDAPDPSLGGDHTAFSAVSGARRTARLTSLLPDSPFPVGAKAAAAPASPQTGHAPATGPIRLNLSAQLLPVDGVARNQAITGHYRQIHAAFADYMGDPPLSDWSRMAVAASSEVGGQLRDARDIRTSVQTLIDGREGNEVAAMRHLYGRLSEDGAVPKGAALLMASGGIDLSTVGGLGMALLGRGSSLLGDAKTRAVSAVVTSLESVERQLAAGNRAIFLTIAPAYEVFLAAETSQPPRDGIAALKDSPAVKEAPLIIEAFTFYKLARQTPNLTERSQYMQMANVLIARHEQQNVVQRYMEPIRNELRLVSPTLTYEPPGLQHRVKIFPSGGDWGNVEDRLLAISRVSQAFLSNDLKRS